MSEYEPHDETALAGLPEPLTWAVQQKVMTLDEAQEFHEQYPHYRIAKLWRLIYGLATPADQQVSAVYGERPILDPEVVPSCDQQSQRDKQVLDDEQSIAMHDHVPTRITELERSLRLRLIRIEERARLLEETADYLMAAVAKLAAQDTLAQGLIPDLRDVSLLEIQIFHTPELTRKQRQGGHTEWSLRVRVSVAGRRIRQEVNTALYPGRVFAEQVFNAAADIPATIEQHANEARVQPDVLYGMLKRLTSGAGTPRSRRHFVILSGYITDEPQVEIYVDEVCAKCTDFRPGAGSRRGHAKWYGQCKPTLSR
jgi:hypothetical protein